MLCLYIRSSSFGSFRSCEHRYMMEYNLSIPSVANKKADLGNCLHKCLEMLAWRKLCEQRGQVSFEDDLLGLVYPCECTPTLLLDRIFEKEIEKGIHKYTKTDRRNVAEWVDNVLTYGKGGYNPLNLTVVQPETVFDLEIKRDWSWYEFDLNGQHYEGYVRLKGTADLITESGIPGVLQCTDYKSGSRVDWGKANTPVKTPEMMYNDVQMRLYYWALRQLYPEATDMLMTLFYSRDTEIGGWNGVPKSTHKCGPFHIPFSDEILPEIEEMIKTTFQKIISIDVPKLTIDWRCSKFCYFGKTLSEDPSKTLCQFYKDKVENVGLIKTIELYGNLNKLGKYQDGGGRKAKENNE